jgi:phenylacetate-coenzyme A ligase PaaK-like adenylate-forming protein
MPTDPEHEARTVQAIARAFTDIPYYASKGRAAPAAGDALEPTLAALPLLFKKDLRATLPKQWVPKGRDAKAELASGELELVETTGSAEDRLRILWDKGWWPKQRERAMRTHPIVGAALGQGYCEAVLSTPATGMATCHTDELSYADRVVGHRLFLNMRPDPTFWQLDDMDRMIDEIAHHGTVGLESDPGYLATLARRAAATGKRIDVKAFVLLTNAFVTRASVRAIRRVYDGPLLQMYGATEVGALFMEGPGGLLHHAPFTTHVELLPAKVKTPGAENVALVVVTSLDRIAQPLVRFVLGDLVQVAPNAPRVHTTVPALTSIEGPVQDALVLPDGGLVTTGAVDRALGAIEAVAQFQIDQRTSDGAEVGILLEEDAGEADVTRALEDVTRALAALAPGLTLDVRRVTAIAAEPNGRFRVVRRHFPIDYAATFAASAAVAS